MTVKIDSDPSIKQKRAADPSRSVWVSASAGTGKTKVLTDRVLALLLSGSPPHRLLCLTFTKAAAAEMANRLNQVLSEWAIIDEIELKKKIKFLTDKPADEVTLRRARTLFAQVLDVPGGMKIQTVHAFCESLLGRFPLEAGLAPYFQVMDEREANEIQSEAQAIILTQARYIERTPLAGALADVTKHIQESDFDKLLGELFSERGRIRRLIERFGGLERLTDHVFKILQVSRSETEHSIRKAACKDLVFDFESLQKASAAMASGGKTDKKNGTIIAQWIELSDSQRLETFTLYLSAFFTLGGSKRAKLIFKEAEALCPTASLILEKEAERLGAVLLKIRGIITAQATSAILILVQSLLDVYETCKKERARLDYDDLILKTRSLLEAEGNVSWVMFKLDGGIDHILIDEAQDTNPDQWAIISALAEEFFVGESASEIERTLFAVGDAKQSIYSFQRADPKAFGEMCSYFRTKADDASKPWEDINLDVSFRSTASVLEIVDEVFAQDLAALGVVEVDQKLHHEPLRDGQAGVVELWPSVGPVDLKELSPWSPPITARWDQDPQTQLADGLATQIADWIKNGEVLESKNRPLHAGDIMILVRRRGTFVEKLVRALKRENVPVAGVDRMVLSEQLAVRDLIAIGNFLLLPEDDLNLAIVLKSPLIGFSEEELFELAYNRGESNLWVSLSSRRDENPIFRFAFKELSTLLNIVDFTPPFELFSEILGSRGGRKKILARLGAEANDPIDEFLTLAFDYERSQPPSLQGFLYWLDTDDIEVKRDLEHATRNEVRVMTVHGSKGLQAPIVFLPDSLQVPSEVPRLLWTKDGILLWPPRRRYMEKLGEAALSMASETRDSEYRRLLYVAMTRSEDRLYVCGWHTRRQASKGNWYELVEAALKKVGVPFQFDLTNVSSKGWKGTGWRFENPQLREVPEDQSQTVILPKPLPGWVNNAPDLDPIPAKSLSPSRPVGPELAIRSPLVVGKIDSFRRGLIIHRLLQLLPGTPEEERIKATERFLAHPIHDLKVEEQRAFTSEVIDIVTNKEFAEIFGPNSRSEVPITGRLGKYVVVGQVDRLLVKPDNVMIVDYKSSQLPPSDAEDVSPVYLKQMAAYRAVLSSAFPGRAIDCALLWTDTPSLMPLSDDLLTKHSDHLDA